MANPILVTGAAGRVGAVGRRCSGARDSGSREGRLDGRQP